MFGASGRTTEGDAGWNVRPSGVEGALDISLDECAANEGSKSFKKGTRLNIKFPHSISLK